MAFLLLSFSQRWCSRGHILKSLASKPTSSGVMQPRSYVNIRMKPQSDLAKVVNICWAKIFQIPSRNFVTLFMRVEVDLKTTLVTSLLSYFQ